MTEKLLSGRNAIAKENLGTIVVKLDRHKVGIFCFACLLFYMFNVI